MRLTPEYIDAHWNQPITINALVEASGASARALFKNFAKAYGCSPMQYVKKPRLEKARELLTDGGTKQSVTAVAFACGFLNLGHFARDYQSIWRIALSDAFAQSIPEIIWFAAGAMRVAADKIRTSGLHL